MKFVILLPAMKDIIREYRKDNRDVNESVWNGDDVGHGGGLESRQAVGQSQLGLTRQNTNRLVWRLWTISFQITFRLFQIISHTNLEGCHI